MKILACVLSYKMAKVTDDTVDALERVGMAHGKNLFVFENQEGPTHSDEGGCHGTIPIGVLEASRYVTHFTGSNLRMTGGFNYICDWVDKNHPDTDVVWFCTNDFEILDSTMIVPGNLAEVFAHEHVGWWHPSLEPIPDYAYPWMFTQELPEPEPMGHGGAESLARYKMHRAYNDAMHGGRSVRMTDFICPAIRWSALKWIHRENGFWFDPLFHRGWGIDYETCLFLRRMGLSIRVDDRMQIRHVASKTYTSGAAPESKEEFYSEAMKEMNAVMYAKYGPQWRKVMTT